MKRHHVVIVAIMAILSAPLVAGALPYEQLGVTQTGSTETLVQTLSVPGNGATVVTSPLQPDRFYRLQLSGTWIWDTDFGVSRQADAAFFTTNEWGTHSRGPTSPTAVVEGQRLSDCFRMGSPGSPCSTPPVYSGDGSHPYSLQTVGREGDDGIQISIADTEYGDNFGGITVRLYLLAKVVMTFAKEIEFGVDKIVTPGVSETAIEEIQIHEGVKVTPTVNGTTIPEVPLTDVILVEFKHPTRSGKIDKSQMCLFVNGNEVANTCILDLYNYGTNGESQTPDEHAPDDIPETPLCDPECVIPVDTGPIKIDRTVLVREVAPITQETPLPPGSKMHLSLEWKADLGHLYRLGREPFLGTGATPWAPFDYRNPAEYAWFFANLNNLGLTVTTSIELPANDGCPAPCYFLSPRTATTPGGGQLLQAMMATSTEYSG